ncbi:MAG: AbrB/MazE/SpoVT family DNA-binding domain-containing protein [Desulfurococcales archaeon]|nr:AbrB/MazE/SpoVT family DNA-binding domain-containing protein [Desulfurococcales archaeon]
MGLVVETRVGRKRVIVIPKAIADAVGISEGQKVRVMAVGDKIVIEPVRDAVWLALYGRKIGRILPEELEEESIVEQERLSKG